jgi:hypothetical protein
VQPKGLRATLDNRDIRRAEEFDRAIERVCRYYGNDLAAFIRDVQRATAKNADPSKHKKSLEK